MVDWTSVLIGIGTSLIATGASGLLKIAYVRLKNRKKQVDFKKSTNRTKVELKPYKKISSVGLKDSRNSTFPNMVEVPLDIDVRSLKLPYNPLICFTQTVGRINRC